MGGAVIAALAIVTAMALLLWRMDTAAELTGPIKAYSRYVFVPSESSGMVAVIDSENDRVVARLETGGTGGTALVSRETGLLVTADPAGRRLALYDLIDRNTLPAIALPVEPQTIAISPDSYLIAVAADSSDEIAVVSLATRGVIKTVTTMPGRKNLTFSLDGSQIYATSPGRRDLAVIDIVQEKQVAEIELTDTGGLGAATRTPDGRLALVSQEGGHHTSLLDLSRMRKITELRTGSEPGRAYGTTYGKYMLVPANEDRSLIVISPEMQDVVARLPAARDVISVNTGWFEKVGVAISESERKAIVYDLEKLQPVDEIALDGTPGKGVVTPDGLKLYVALAESNSVAAIDLRDRALLKVIRNVGESPKNAVMGLSNNYCH